MSACWAPPSAAVRPAGKPRIVARAIEVERDVDSATVASVDRAARTIVLSVQGIALPPCQIGPGVRNWRDLGSGAVVRARIEEAVTVYVAPMRGLTPDARVLVADRSYRVLTVQYPDGDTDAFKVGLRAPMKDIAAGDSVVIRPLEVIELRARRHSSPKHGSRSRASVASAR